jgi:hypothetical protein
MWPGANPTSSLTNALAGPAPQPATGGNSFGWTGGDTFYGATPQANVIGSQAQAHIDPNILNSFQNYTDAAYQQQQRTLDPQWQQKQSAFAQQMVGQGLQPGSAAYDNAMRDFSASQNDAYNQARLSSMQAGLGAQGQAFGEGLSNATLQNQRDIAGIGANAQRAAASMGAHASMYGSDASMANNAANNATSQLLGLGNLGLGYNAQNMQQGQNDFQNMLEAFGYGRQGDMYNNSQTSGAAQNLLGMIPNSGPSPIDVTGAYGLNQSGQNAQYNAQSAQANATNQTEGQLASAALMMAMMMSSRELKDDHGAIDPEKTLEAVKSLPLHEWSYKAEERKHVGTFAEDFHKALGLPESQGIHFIDMFGALIGSVQALTTRLEAIERKLA